jgi:hypothetical protein
MKIQIARSTVAAVHSLISRLADEINASELATKSNDSPFNPSELPPIYEFFVEEGKIFENKVMTVTLVDGSAGTEAEILISDLFISEFLMSCEKTASSFINAWVSFAHYNKLSTRIQKALVKRWFF